ncbi:MAG TPA: AmmeMemoRadiSam system protein B [Candidatus Desulfovibrio intestinipullorum]|uniref:MEMO1 family protein H9894_03885 n=1 Tax=Candidatus Desulfovibrio intestinipullorum TaxID=2838536 RepID=A0A9D1PVE9_9BACT|nr:AmmeMemoRadiSam system protein B [Candidatus Desulfovibrio intestinipullorum]
MPDRKAVVAGRFYPGSSDELQALLHDLFTALKDSGLDDNGQEDTPCAVMAPHAGYIFSAPVAARALVHTRVPETVIVLCPNHTGMGRSRFGVWPDGAWETPLGPVAVNTELAGQLMAAGPVYAGDRLCHQNEHAIEVLLPFLQYLRPDVRIVPVCIACQHTPTLRNAGEMLASVLGDSLDTGAVGILVSSDMNHYEKESVALKKDERALECVLAEDPEGLIERCASERITMCGAGPMALTLHCLKCLRPQASRPARLMGHTTSGMVNKDFDRVVGYAGVRFYA